jgi:hypothetical protein
LALVRPRSYADPEEWSSEETSMMRIVPGDFSDARVVDLMHVHLTSARAETVSGSAHALDLTALQSPDISLWTIWDDETLLGAGALKRLSADHGEVKSMYTVWSLRRRGREARCCATSLRLHEQGACRASASRRAHGTIFCLRRRSTGAMASWSARHSLTMCSTRTASSCRSNCENPDPQDIRPRS